MVPLHRDSGNLLIFTIKQQNTYLKRTLKLGKLAVITVIKVVVGQDKHQSYHIYTRISVFNVQLRFFSINVFFCTNQIGSFLCYISHVFHILLARVKIVYIFTLTYQPNDQYCIFFPQLVLNRLHSNHHTVHCQLYQWAVRYLC